MEIPRSTENIRDILRWWILSDKIAALEKGLIYWSVEERNAKTLRDGKVVSNQALYATRKTMSLAFFHYCESNYVVDYEKDFTSISERRMVKKTTGSLDVIARRMSYQNCLSSKTCGSSSR